MTVFPTLVATKMIESDCHVSIAAVIYQAMQGRPEIENAILWLRIQGYSYGEIGRELNINKGRVWQIVNGPIKNVIYSVLLSATDGVM